MTILVIVTFAVGGVLERFFKVLILVPACMVVLVVVVVRAVSVGHGPLHAILEFAVLITSLQIGYVSTLVLITVRRKLQSVDPAHAPRAASSPKAETRHSP